jgi:hypothetical protein
MRVVVLQWKWLKNHCLRIDTLTPKARAEYVKNVMAGAAGFKVFDYNITTMKVWAGCLDFANTTGFAMWLESNGGDMYRIKNSKVGILNEH